eukprot:CAMPEP_0181211694 /NCGR_PEP_ID=MMETSP1096-20121128/23938_1 /TAXON_ID=156174 ORGANISM="Chrysochromulina ericina, Strain CCMP281" /NCGR_SAMPLE_ID=MMETSP1096 /ASSEMBLY_ACC=CAM_ASM_000453 /LENGTH=91 /DNA_ID=CAMNT_0023303143 /DNA_START=185 /DNA_END=457 /DNA_ORIENTATION=-
MGHGIVSTLGSSHKRVATAADYNAADQMCVKHHTRRMWRGRDVPSTPNRSSKGSARSCVRIPTQLRSSHHPGEQRKAPSLSSRSRLAFAPP